MCCAAAMRTKWWWWLFPLAFHAQVWNTAHLLNILMEMLKLLARQYCNLCCSATDWVLLMFVSDQSFHSMYFVLKDNYFVHTVSFQQQDLQAMLHNSNSSRLWLAHNADMPLSPLFRFILFNTCCRWCLMMFNYCLLILSGSFLGLGQAFLIQVFNIGSWLIRILKIL